MPPLPEMRKKTIEAIGEVLTEDQIVSVVMAATGKNIFNIYASPNDPRATQLSKTLDQLELEGTERWLLTYLLIAIVREEIRRKIVKTWPNTLVSLPQAEGQVESTLTFLNTLLPLPLTNNVKQELKIKLKQDAFKEIRHRIDALYVYKNLHEDLHQLSLKLTFGELVQSVSAANPDFKGIAEQCDKTLRDSPSLEASLGSNSEDTRIERDWISRLQAITNSLNSALAASDTAACLRAVDNIQQLIKMNLSRLNAKVFKAATDLSFEALTSNLPETIEDAAAFDKLVRAIRELKPTVLARALKHNLWQETENDISLVEDFFNIPGQEVADISESWFAVKSRVLWLAELDPDDPWAGKARQFSDQIDDQMVQKKELDDQIRAQFGIYRNLFRFRFLAIDNTLKLDCGSLRKIDMPLAAILNELDPPSAAEEHGP
jgi:hypothetical protein